jgi:hypothetical protein
MNFTVILYEHVDICTVFTLKVGDPEANNNNNNNNSDKTEKKI